MRSLFTFLFLLLSAFAGAQLRLPAFFNDQMVLQRDKPNKIWGWDKPGNLVTVKLGGKTYQSVADAAGQWSVFAEPLKAGVVGTMNVNSPSGSLEIKDILAGEVWICSGQSNMEWRMDMLPETYPDELRAASNNQIRFTTINKWLATTPVSDAEILNKWAPVTPATVGNCSAVAYWFAKKLQKDLQVPVGLIVTAWGGTPAQAWTSFEGLYGFPQYAKSYLDNVRPLDLNNLSEKKKEFYQQYQLQVVQRSAYSAMALQTDFDDSGWKEMNLPGPWETQGYPALDGVVTYRLWFTVAQADAGKAAIINTPGIDDIDSTYINGQFIGTTDQWDKPRSYTIPAGILKAGKNLLAVRVTDNQGGGGFAAVPDKFHIRVGDKIIPLSGKAKFDIIAELPDLTAGHGAIEHQPSVLFNAMIAPLLPLSVRGAIWYQGESNADTKEGALEYRTLFPAMIQDWRNRWGQGDFPFLFVQLASFGPLQKEPSETNWPLLREAQTRTLQLPNTGMAVTTDIGDPADIHPKRKKEVGDRLAAEALRITYGKNSLISHGPEFAYAVARDNQLIVHFNHTGKGLMAKGGPLKHFAIAGKDKKFYWADAVIRGNQVILTSKQVPRPVAVRYAWADSPVEANLYNKEGYPAGPFRSDEW